MDARVSEDYTIILSTRRNAVLFLGSFLFVSGYGSGQPALVAGGQFLLILLAVEWLLGATYLDTIKVTRSHYPRTFEGEQMVVDLDVRNEGTAKLFLLEAIDSFPPSSAYFARNLAVTLPGTSAVRFRYNQTISRRRGLYIIGPIKLRARDPLGLFTFKETVDEFTQLMIYPTAERLSGFDVLSGGTHANIGSEIVRQIGRSEEFERLRSYRHGDSPRLIHWPSTARMREPQVKEFERNVITQVSIYCDMHILALSGLGDLTTVEYRLRVAASIAAESIRKGHQVKVIAVKEPRQETRLAGGSNHLVAILDWMAILKPEGSGEFEAEILKDAGTLKPGSTMIVVLSSIHVELQVLHQAVRLLRMRRVHVIAVLVDDRSFLKLRREQEHLYMKAPPLEDLVSMLRQASVPAFVVKNTQDVDQALGVPA